MKLPFLSRDVITLQFRLKDGLLAEVPLLIKVDGVEVKDSKLHINIVVDCSRAKSLLKDMSEIEALERVY